MGSSCDFLHFDRSGAATINCDARASNIDDEATESSLVHDEEFASGANSKFIQAESVF